MAVNSAYMKEVLSEIEESFIVKPKGCARFMKKGISLLVFILLLSLVFAVPAFAQDNNGEEDPEEVTVFSPREYRYTGTIFAYMGKVFHEKEFNTFDGSGFFRAQGMGTAGGYHYVHTKGDATGVTTNIDLHLSGSTFADNSLELARIERETIAQAEANRTREIAQLNRMVQENPGYPISEYERRMKAINDYYDNLINRIYAEFSDSKQNMRIESKVVANDSEIYAGIEMNPGETGYIKKNVASTKTSEGEYLRANSHIKNTGGITRKSTDYASGGTTFIEENVLIIGYADLWESTKMQRGNAKTGFWDKTP